MMSFSREKSFKTLWRWRYCERICLKSIIDDSVFSQEYPQCSLNLIYTHSCILFRKTKYSTYTLLERLARWFLCCYHENSFDKSHRQACDISSLIVVHIKTVFLPFPLFLFSNRFYRLCLYSLVIFNKLIPFFYDYPRIYTVSNFK